jgi:hypothetical protein
MHLFPEANQQDLHDVSTAIAHLIQEEKLPPSQIFLSALEGKNAVMAYWTIHHLVKDYCVNVLHPVGFWDNNPQGEPILPIHAAVVVNNVGALAALLELEAFEGDVQGRQFEALVRMCEQAESDVMGVLIRYLEAKNQLNLLMRPR